MPSTPRSASTGSRQIHYRHSSSSFASIGSESLLDHSHLKPGNNASLLDYSKTVTMYSDNAKKTRSAAIQCEFAVFLIKAAKSLKAKDIITTDDETKIQSYLLEAEKLLKKLASSSHSESQYHLATMYAAGLCYFHKKLKVNARKAFTLYVQAAKHHHSDASYQTGKAYEEGIGTKRDKTKAVQFYRRAATSNHPGAMYRLGIAEIHGHLGLVKNLRNGYKWLKRSSEAATPEHPEALHVLGVLYEQGNQITFSDHAYAFSLYYEAHALGYSPSTYRLGQCYARSELGCLQDMRRAIECFSLSAENQHPEACIAMAKYCLEGVPHLLVPSEQQAFYWVHLAAQKCFPEAEYTLGCFYEKGLGVESDLTKAMVYYGKSAKNGVNNAVKRLQKDKQDKKDKKTKGKQEKKQK
ncbi:hypothetical protein BDF14DRAFT_1715952 [Spinellus fusiger]|nr:hypothetical protein BDF14DRAFT_1715952 [Spinellus fusiger]